ncbi:hypothetical protein R3P38DRAFT_2861799 [Favolaschia claudopus]|uniref:Uncharacterized protein n=1 Tax=Favolaschia claudopus TaxID=2862362 RepID=A0AAW0DKT1_9AGAR
MHTIRLHLTTCPLLLISAPRTLRSAHRTKRPFITVIIIIPAKKDNTYSVQSRKDGVSLAETTHPRPSPSSSKNPPLLYPQLDARSSNTGHDASQSITSSASTSLRPPPPNPPLSAP